MRRNLMLIWLGPWIVLAQVTGAGQAQVTEADSQWRARCIAAVSAIENRRSKDEVVEALWTLRVCERSAGSALSGVWRARPTDRAEIAALAAASRDVRDRRIMDEAIRTARDRAESGDLRIAALTVLGAYMDPSIVSIHEGPDYIQGYHIRRTFHPSQKDGTVPLGDAYAETILRTLDELAAGGEADGQIARFAGYLTAYLGRDRGGSDLE